MAFKNPIIENMRRLQKNGATGVLRLEKSGKEISIYFREGLIDAAGSNIIHLQLGRLLTSSGIVSSAAISGLLQEAQRKKICLGKAAVNRRLLDEAQLEDIVRHQIVEVIGLALGQNFEQVSFGASKSNFYAPARLEFAHALLEIARRDTNGFKVQPGRIVELRRGVDLSHLPWYPMELSVLGELKEPRTIQDLATSTGMDYSRLDKVLSVLNSLQLLSVADAPGAESLALVKRESFPFAHLTPVIRRTGLDEKLETIHREHSFVSEQFNSLKVKLREAAAGKGIRVITVSSAQPEDGKTLVTANLAAALSKDPGRRVIVIDCDLRNPSLHRILGTSAEPGLLGFLENDFLQPYCYMRRFEKMYLLTAGGIAENPVELLTSDKMMRLLAYLKTEFDTILLDSPPFLPITDAQILTSLSDALLLVVRSGKTSYGNLEKAYGNVDKEKLLGVVLNDVKPMMFNTQYDHRYYYYNRQPYPSPKPVAKPRTYLDD